MEIQKDENDSDKEDKIQKYGTVTVKAPQGPTKCPIKYRTLGSKNCPIDENEDVLIIFDFNFNISFSIQIFLIKDQARSKDLKIVKTFIHLAFERILSKKQKILIT